MLLPEKVMPIKWKEVEETNTHTRTHTLRSFARSKNIERNFDWRCRVLIIIYNTHIYIIRSMERERESERVSEYKCTYSFHISHFTFRSVLAVHDDAFLHCCCFLQSLSLSLASIRWVFCVTPKLTVKTCITHTQHTYSYFCFKTNINSHYGLNFCSFVCLCSRHEWEWEGMRASERVTIILYMAIYYWYYDAMAEEMSNELTD